MKKTLEIGDIIINTNELRPTQIEEVVRVTDTVAICKSGLRLKRIGFDFWLSEIELIGFRFLKNKKKQGIQ